LRREIISANECPLIGKLVWLRNGYNKREAADPLMAGTEPELPVRSGLRNAVSGHSAEEPPSCHEIIEIET
jgi:hypothetical protein